MAQQLLQQFFFQLLQPGQQAQSRRRQRQQRPFLQQFSLQPAGQFFQSAGQLVRLAPCDLSALLKDLVYAFLPELNRRRIRLDAQGIQAGITADGDAVRLKQAWMNLIKNAAEALDDGGLIRLSLCREKESAVLTVADNGPGIPAQEADAIFLPYHTTKEHGTGLGLPIAREIAQAHGGSLTCRSSGEGTAFTFSLPLHSRLPGQPL